MSIKIKFEPRDIWVGLYWDRCIYRGAVSDLKVLQLFICIIPMLPIILEFEKETQHPLRPGYL